MLSKTWQKIVVGAATISSLVVGIAKVEAGQGYKLPFHPEDTPIQVTQSGVDSIDGTNYLHDGDTSGAGELQQYAIDFGCGVNNYDIIAIMDGNVVQKVTNDAWKGNFIRIQHANGRISLYAHLKDPSPVEGFVKQGQVIGQCGNTGHSKGTHLHLELQKSDSELTDRDRYLQQKLGNRPSDRKTTPIYFDECDNNSSCKDGQVYYDKSYKSQNILRQYPHPGGYGIYYWNGSGWTGSGGDAVRIAVAPDGKAWVVNGLDGAIFKWMGNGWQHIPGCAKDIGIGANGSTWVIDCHPTLGGYGIEYWNGSGWTAVGGGAVGIAVAPDGKPWVVNNLDGAIFKWMGNGWQHLPGCANDIGIGANGSTWVIGCN